MLFFQKMTTTSMTSKDCTTPGSTTATSTSHATLSEDTMIPSTVGPQEDEVLWHFNHTIEPGNHLFGYCCTPVEAFQVVYDYEIATTTRFLKSGKHGDFGADLDSLKCKHRVHFESALPLQGLPHMIIGSRDMECQHGTDHWSKTPSKIKREAREYKFKRRKRNTNKFKCQCVVKMWDILLFIEPRLESNTKYYRHELSKQIRNDVSSCKVERRIYIELPDVKKHNHPTGQAAGIIQHLDKRVIEEIHTYCNTKGNDITKQEIRRHIEYFVKNVLFTSGNCPHKSNRRFYPLERDIANHLKVARSAGKGIKRKNDLTNLQDKIKQWNGTKHMKDDYFFLRTEGEFKESDDVTNENILLYIHQTTNQKRLMQLYGNEITLLDPTFRTTKYDIPLYMVMVPTNCDYQVVAEFVVSEYTTTAIQEALIALKHQNPSWQPKWWMVDNSKEEIQAVEATFSDSQILLCDFHIQQAWERWLAKPSNKVLQFKESLIVKMRRIAQAKTDLDFIKAVDDLYHSHEWNHDDSKHFRAWFTNIWLQQSEKWVWAFWNKNLMPSINTNSGVESQNQALNHEYLKKRKHLSLTAMLVYLVEECVPDQYARYISTNSSWSLNAKKYSISVDKQLRGRPLNFVNHCRKQLTEAEDIPSYRITHMEDNGKFNVESCSQDLVPYAVDLTFPCCTCYDFQQSGWPCKHMFAIFNRCDGWNFDRLPSAYRGSPFLNIDQGVVCNNPFMNDDDMDTESSADIDIVDNNDEDAEISNNVTVIHPLPSLNSFYRSEATATQASVKTLTNLCTLITEPTVLLKARVKMEEAIQILRSSINKEDGLHLLQGKNDVAENNILSTGLISSTEFSTNR